MLTGNISDFLRLKVSCDDDRSSHSLFCQCTGFRPTQPPMVVKPPVTELRPTECNLPVSQKKPVLPHLPPKPPHPHTIHFEPQVKPLSRNAAEIEPEFFGGPDDVLATSPCSEGPVTSDSTVTSAAAASLSSVEKPRPGRPSPSHSQSWAVASSSISSDSDNPTFSAKPVVPVGQARPPRPLYDNAQPTTTPYSGGYVLNLAGPGAYQSSDQEDGRKETRELPLPDATIETTRGSTDSDTLTPKLIRQGSLSQKQGEKHDGTRLHAEVDDCSQSGSKYGDCKKMRVRRELGHVVPSPSNNVRFITFFSRQTSDIVKDSASDAGLAGELMRPSRTLINCLANLTLIR